jgi:hypothetical protein
MELLLARNVSRVTPLETFPNRKKSAPPIRTVSCASLRKASTHVFVRRFSCSAFAAGSRGGHSAPVASCKLLVTVLHFIGPAKRLQPTAM